MLHDNNSLNKLRYFNDSQENISYISPYNETPFIITCKISFKEDQIAEVEFRGYDLHKIKETDKHLGRFMYLRCVVKYDDKHSSMQHLYICDFGVEYSRRDNGYGSIMLEHLVEYAKSINATYISGSLSSKDIGVDGDESKKDNRERLYHFYPKHGFIITADEKIYLSLK